MSLSDGSVELSEAIEAVREQLTKARAGGRRSGTSDELTFVVGKVSVEFRGEVTRTAGVGGGVKFWVVNADAKAEHARGTSQTVTVELTPEAPGGAAYRVSDDLDAPPKH